MGWVHNSKSGKNPRIRFLLIRIQTDPDYCSLLCVCRGRGEECVVLGKSLVSLATFTLSTTTHTILRLVQLRDSKVGWGGGGGAARGGEGGLLLRG